MQELRQMAQVEALPPVEAVALAGPASHRCGGSSHRRGFFLEQHASSPC